jgi:hypothetical protein
VQLYVGMPSPVSTSLFASGSPVDGGPAVRNASGSVLAVAAPPGRARSFVPPWGLVDDEMRFITPHGGHGGLGYRLSLLQPYVEQPPYNGPALLQLKREAWGAELLLTPATGPVVGTVEASRRFAAQDVRSLRLEPGLPGYERHCALLNLLSQAPSGSECRGALWGIWVQVQTPGSPDGWLLLHVNPEGA